tara:strand:- start:340 stop:474 length:135 start_codon:yes stop_codon:yes gene_type:complete
MSSLFPEFYESIVEASNRGELWGLDIPPGKIVNMDNFFDPSVYN